MILIIDHYDSFVHNLARYFECLGYDTKIIRSDKLSFNDIIAYNPEALVFSPGPCTPKDTPQSIEIIKHVHTTLPILGVCLGHQCIAEAFEGITVKSAKPSHGKASLIYHQKDPLFKDIPSPFTAGRYHSLISDLSHTKYLVPTAHTDDQILMGFKHQTYPTYGLQFHPESILTEHGLVLLKNFMIEAKTWRTKSG